MFTEGQKCQEKHFVSHASTGVQNEGEIGWRDLHRTNLSDHFHWQWDIYFYFILFYSISVAYYGMQNKRNKYNKGISIINVKLGRDTTTAISQLQWSHNLKIYKNKNNNNNKKKKTNKDRKKICFIWECLMVVGRGSWVQSRGSWVVGTKSWVIINNY